MSQKVGSGGARVGARWTLQADQALEPLEAQFDAPTQAIEGKDVIGGKAVGGAR